VTAVDAAGRLYRQANYGRHIEFAAPGVDLYVAWGNGGSYRSGTSFAAPVVTAVLARQAARGGLSLDGARSFLRARVRDLGPGGRDDRYGFGLVQSGGC
jgi:subtilisin family serine protease